MRSNETLDGVVVALCRDYFRRCEAIKCAVYTSRTLMEYQYYNFKIFDGAAEIVGEEAAEKYIYEIGESSGYGNSRVVDVSEPVYKRKKNEVKRNIAKKLHLAD